MTGRNDNPKRRGAFTLLELILVLVLISVLLGIAAPSLRGFVGARRSADAAAQVLAMANYARSQAIAQGTVYRLNVDATENVYWLTILSGGTTAGSHRNPMLNVLCGVGYRIRQTLRTARYGGH